MDHNYYNILQCKPNDSIDTIKTNYLRLVKEHHPDRNSNSKLSEELVKEYNEAYSVLSDPIKREKYNNYININSNTEVTFNRNVQKNEYKSFFSKTTFVKSVNNQNRSRNILVYLTIWLSIYILGRNIIDWGTEVKYTLYDGYSVIVFLFFTLLIFRKRLFGE
jgi:curved DNA-binding protein CbpA